ncbi:MAG: DUF748 domain-containing protein [Rhodospirillales bacterium]|jgi:hypothetical protein|nr:DUF748 domain-containing protein [Rhodospirillales bacterium]
MTDSDANAAAPAAEASNGHSPPPRRRRRWLRLAAVVLLLLGGLAAFVVYGPQAIARYVATSVLTGLDIDVEGVKTLRINLLKGSIALGPVRFRPLGESEPAGADAAGQLGELLVDLSLRNLWQRNALIKSAAIGGIDIVISRETDGQIAINGIPLRRLLAEEAKDPPPPEKDKAGWGTGVDLLVVRDSRLVFRDAARGTLEIAVSWLELDGFRSWEPDQPGTFTLIGDANGIGVVAWGQAEPFADNIRLRVEAGIDGIEVAKIEAYSGPLPLTARDGSGRVNLRSRATLFADGRLDVASVGAVDIAGANLAGDGWRFAASSGRLALDAAFAGATYASGRITGTVGLDLAGVSAGTGDDLAIAVDEVAARTPSLALELADDGGLTGALPLTTALKGITVRGAGGLAATAGGLDLAVEPASLAMRTDGSGRIGGGITAALADVSVTTGGGADALKLAFAKLAAQLADTSVDLAAGGTAKVTASPKLTLTNITVKGPAEVSVASADLALTPFAVDAGETISVRTAGRLTARTGAVASGDLKASLADLGVGLANIAVEQKGGETRITGEVKTTIATPGLSVAAAPAGPRARAEEIRVDARALGLDATPFAVTLAAAGVGIEGKAGVSLDDARVKLPATAGGPADITVTRLAVAVDRAKGRLGDAISELSGSLNVDVAGGAAQLGMVHRDARSAFGAFTVALAPVDVRQQGDGWQVKGKGRIGLDRASAKLPESDLGPVDSGLGSLAITIASAEAAGRGNRLDWRVAADVGLREIAAKVAGGRLADVQGDRLTLTGVTGDDSLAFAVDRINLGALRASLTRPKGAQAPRPVRVAAEAAAEVREEIVRADADKAGGPTVRINRLRLDAPSQLRLSDPNVEPPARAVVLIRRLDIDNVDTGNAKTKTDVELSATINEFGSVVASGWLTPFADPPDFDLRTEVRGLQLPPFSGLAASAVGVNIDGGQLQTEVRGAAAAGQLKAQVDVIVSDLAFGSLSPEQSARASQAIGVPIETAVGLLKDNDGRIKLSLPISGDLKSPAFDISGVIASAMTGAVTAALTAPFKLALAPVSLIAGAVTAGSAPGLTPIPFAAGSAVVDATGEGIVRGLAQVLKERQGLRLRVCGRTTPADLEVLIARLPDRAKLTTDQLLDQGRAAAQRLAEERTLAARRAFVEGGGVDAGRVGECRAAFDAGDQGPPRADITL